MAALKMESAGAPYIKRVVRDGIVVGFISQFTNGKWGCYDEQDKRVSPETYATAARALAWFRTPTLSKAPQQ